MVLQRAVATVGLEGGLGLASAVADGHGVSSGAGHGVSGEIDVEVVLGEPTGGVAHGRGLGEDLEAGLPQAGAGGCIGIGGVPHHHRLVIRAGVISQQVIRHGAVGGVGRGDQLIVGVD